MAKKNGVPTGFEGIVAYLRDAFGEELESALPELDSAVRAGHGMASCSATVQVKPCKKTRGFMGTLTFRVRAPRPPRDFDLRIGDAGQLELGFDPTPRSAGDEDDDAQGDFAAH